MPRPAGNAPGAGRDVAGAVRSRRQGLPAGGSPVTAHLPGHAGEAGCRCVGASGSAAAPEPAPAPADRRAGFRPTGRRRCGARPRSGPSPRDVVGVRRCRRVDDDRGTAGPRRRAADGVRPRGAGRIAVARRPPRMRVARLAEAGLLGLGLALAAAAVAVSVDPPALGLPLFAVAGLCGGVVLTATLRIRSDFAPPGARPQVLTLGAGLKITAAAAAPGSPASSPSDRPPAPVHRGAPAHGRAPARPPGSGAGPWQASGAPGPYPRRPVTGTVTGRWGGREAHSMG